MTLFVLVAAAALLLALLWAIVRAGRVVVSSPIVDPSRPSSPAAPKLPRVVILGGGFGGVYAARALEQALRASADFELSLITQDNYFVFQPMLPEVISGTIGMVDTVSPIRRLLPRTDVHIRQVLSVDLARRVVMTSPGFDPHPHEIPFDHLLVALGTVTDFRGRRGLPEHARPFKTLSDALALRSHVIRTLEEATIERERTDLVRQLLTFVVAGGGFSGVEAVAELNDFVRAVARQYRGIDPAQIRVILLHSQPRILPEMPEPLARFAESLLRKRGVELRLGVRLEAATGDAAILAGGEQIPTKTLLSTVPSSAHPVVEALPLPKAKGGRLEVDSFLRVKGTMNLWSVGDCALALTPDGKPCPPTAQYATRQAKVAAENIVAVLRGTELKPFTFKELGKMGSLGHRSAVADVFGVQVSGFLAWFLWRTIYLFKLPGWGRRLKVAASWTLDLVLPPDLVQLQLGSPGGFIHEHFEPGQVVFHRGDLGDRLYIVLSGEAEAVTESPDGGEVVLGHIGPGEFFGEMALLHESDRSATVRCVLAMDTLSLPKRDFGLLTKNLAGLKQNVDEVAARRASAPGQRGGASGHGAAAHAGASR
jgi:NADH dehydrogenase